MTHYKLLTQLTYKNLDKLYKASEAKRIAVCIVIDTHLKTFYTSDTIVPSKTKATEITVIEIDLTRLHSDTVINSLYQLTRLIQ